MKLLLTIASGTLAGRIFELESGFLTIGRSENCSVRFDPVSERIASKQHAFIEAKTDGYYLTDNESTNGTILNGERIQMSKIQSGDTIQFGKNGIIGAVMIEQTYADLNNQAPESFRENQISQFNQIAQTEPDNIQDSMLNIGLGQLETTPAAPSRTGRYVGIGVTIFAIIFMSLIVGLLIFASVGIVPAVIGAVVAFAPAIIYLFPLIWLDRYDPEPLWLLALAFAWGALVAVIASFIVNTLVGIGFTLGVSPQAGQIAGAVISAPIFEEALRASGFSCCLYGSGAISTIYSTG